MKTLQLVCSPTGSVVHITGSVIHITNVNEKSVELQSCTSTCTCTCTPVALFSLL